MRYGVVYVAYGRKALSEVKESRKWVPPDLGLYIDDDEDHDLGLTIDQRAHLAKTRTFNWSPFEYTLLLDADTRILDPTRLQIGFDMLRAGWEVVMVPSFPPKEGAILWHLSSQEKDFTFESLGRLDHYMFNTGVLFFHKTQRVKRLFESWEEEWRVFKDRDQGAFLRALKECPVRMFLLGRDFNSQGGNVVKHLFGRASN